MVKILIIKGNLNDLYKSKNHHIIFCGKILAANCWISLKKICKTLPKTLDRNLT